MVFLVHFLLKSWLKTQHSKIKIMASSSITWWQIDRKKYKQRLYFLGLQNHCRWWLQTQERYLLLGCRWWLQTQERYLLLGIKTMTNLDSILKRRGITLPTKVCIVKVMVFPLVICGCQSWTIKKAEHQRIDAFEMWCWSLLVLESPVNSRKIKPVNPKGNQPWTFIGRTDAEAPILWPPDAKRQLTGKDPDIGKD